MKIQFVPTNLTLSSQEIALLEEIGLIKSSELTRIWTIEPNRQSEMVIDEKTAFILENNKQTQVKCSLTIKKLSKIGTDIASLVEQSNRDTFYNNLAKRLKSQGIDHVVKYEIIKFGSKHRYITTGEELMG